MGTVPQVNGHAPIHTFYSANAWIEGAAVDQLATLAALPDVRALAAMPDLHPGKYGPVGCAILSEHIHPAWVGSDIGCGMALFVLDQPVRRLRLDKAPGRLRALAGAWTGDARSRLEAAGLSAKGFAASLGTIGGGNHFCEVQAVADVLDEAWLQRAGLAHDALCLLVHSGSRGLGHQILVDLLGNGLVSLAPQSEPGESYLARHDAAVRWAALNRQIIAERAAAALRMDLQLIADVPHNLVVPQGELMLHRKGAASVPHAARGLIPVAASRGALSHLVRWTGTATAMHTVSHGAGRKFDRSSSRRRGDKTKSNLARLSRNPFGGYILCEDRDLLIEEAPDAYKDCTRVIADLVAHDLVAQVATLKPLLTFKTVKEETR